MSQSRRAHARSQGFGFASAQNVPVLGGSPASGGLPTMPAANRGMPTEESFASLVADLQSLAHDVTFVLDDASEATANRMILGARSEFFEKLIEAGRVHAELKRLTAVDARSGPPLGWPQAAPDGIPAQPWLDALARTVGAPPPVVDAMGALAAADALAQGVSACSFDVNS